jgi:hypothetical protein
MVPGNDKIGEDDNNKYFGAYFSRRLRPNYHITKYLKENMDERYQTFYGFANLISFLPKDQRRLCNKGNVISEDRKLKTEPVTEHILVSFI